jgi:uncharacterized membrane protein YkvA (DUF1232 family)
MSSKSHTTTPAAGDIAPVTVYEGHYTSSSFWSKLGAYATVAGREVVEKALYLYYAAQNPDMPAWARTVVFGALGYFILPADAVPDLIPAVGFSDDLGALAFALTIVIMHITPAVKEKARAKLRDWFEDEAKASEQR